MLLASWTFDIVLKEFRSFNAENLGSVGERAAKFLAIKLWEWFDPGPNALSHNLAGMAEVADFFLEKSNFDS